MKQNRAESVVERARRYGVAWLTESDLEALLVAVEAANKYVKSLGPTITATRLKRFNDFNDMVDKLDAIYATPEERGE